MNSNRVRRVRTSREFRANLRDNLEYMQGGGALEINGYIYECVHIDEWLKKAN